MNTKRALSHLLGQRSMKMSYQEIFAQLRAMKPSDFKKDVLYNVCKDMGITASKNKFTRQTGYDMIIALLQEKTKKQGGITNPTKPSKPLPFNLSTLTASLAVPESIYLRTETAANILQTPCISDDLRPLVNQLRSKIPGIELILCTKQQAENGMFCLDKYNNLDELLREIIDKYNGASIQDFHTYVSVQLNNRSYIRNEYQDDNEKLDAVRLLVSQTMISYLLDEPIAITLPDIVGFSAGELCLMKLKTVLSWWISVSPQPQGGSQRKNKSKHMMTGGVGLFDTEKLKAAFKACFCGASNVVLPIDVPKQANAHTSLPRAAPTRPPAAARPVAAQQVQPSPVTPHIPGPPIFQVSTPLPARMPLQPRPPTYVLPSYTPLTPPHPASYHMRPVVTMLPGSTLPAIGPISTYHMAPTITHALQQPSTPAITLNANCPLCFIYQTSDEPLCGYISILTSLFYSSDIRAIISKHKPKDSRMMALLEDLFDRMKFDDLLDAANPKASKLEDLYQQHKRLNMLLHMTATSILTRLNEINPARFVRPEMIVFHDLTTSKHFKDFAIALLDELSIPWGMFYRHVYPSGQLMLQTDNVSHLNFRENNMVVLTTAHRFLKSNAIYQISITDKSVNSFKVNTSEPAFELNTSAMLVFTTGTTNPQQGHAITGFKNKDNEYLYNGHDINKDQAPIPCPPFRVKWNSLHSPHLLLHDDCNLVKAPLASTKDYYTIHIDTHNFGTALIMMHVPTTTFNPRPEWSIDDTLRVSVLEANAMLHNAQILQPRVWSTKDEYILYLPDVKYVVDALTKTGEFVYKVPRSMVKFPSSYHTIYASDIQQLFTPEMVTFEVVTSPYHYYFSIGEDNHHLLLSVLACNDYIDDNNGVYGLLEDIRSSCVGEDPDEQTIKAGISEILSMHGINADHMEVNYMNYAEKLKNALIANKMGDKLDNFAKTILTCICRAAACWHLSTIGCTIAHMTPVIYPPPLPSTGGRRKTQSMCKI